MKSVLIVTNKMVMGGIEKSLISLVNSFDKSKYKVTVFLMEYGGELIDEIPKDVSVNIIPSINDTVVKRIKRGLKDKDLFQALSIAYYSILTKLTKKSYKGAYYYSKILNKPKETYDLAISYYTPLGFPTGYVVNNIKSKKKIAFIHGDMDQYKNIKYLKNIVYMYKKYYGKYDKIFCVSKDAQKKFIKYFPTLETKVDIFFNILNNTEIKAKSLECGFNDNFNGIRIVTVGRLSEEKCQILIPKLVKRLVDDNFNIKWYCIGDGESRKEIENMIEQFNIHKELILLGTQSNPYSFIKNSDIYVQTSKHEGYCITLAEAKLLAKPIITTDFVGAREQIENGKNGIIVNFSEDELYESIKKLILNEKLRIKFSENLLLNTYSNNKEINKLYEFMK